MMHVRVEYRPIFYSATQAGRFNNYRQIKPNSTTPSHHQHRYHDMTIYVQSDFDFIIAGNAQTDVVRLNCRESGRKGEDVKVF